jgi:hypothetical protein
MAEPLSLMEFLQAILTEADLRDSFAHEPQGTLAVHGLADLTPDDVHDALVLVQDNQTVDYSLDLSGTPAPPPPPPAGESHEAAVEYLARYLAGPPQPAAEEPWSTLDPDATEPGPGGAPADPSEEFGTGVDDEYGAGTAGVPEHVTEPIDLTGYDAGYDTGFDSGFDPDMAPPVADDTTPDTRDDLGDVDVAEHGALDVDHGTA